MPRIKPPKPPSRSDRASIAERLRLFRKDMFRSQPERLYSARMAQIRTPLYHSFLLNQPDLVREVLEGRPSDFPKSDIVTRALDPLLGQSVFVTNGADWARQRRIIDPAFEAGRIKNSFPAMQAAGEAALARLTDGVCEVEAETSHLTADIIFRTLFSIEIRSKDARAVFDAFQAYQRAQPLLSPLDLIRAPKWVPRRARGKEHAEKIRSLLSKMVESRQQDIDDGCAPNDLATKIMTTPDPQTGKKFTKNEMVDQVAIFFLAGHETSASALSWALYCLACDPEAQRDVATEVAHVCGDGPIAFEHVAKLRFTRDVFREVLRLYPPVPMMVREAVGSEEFRKVRVPPKSLCMISPWYIQRNTQLWANPDVFDPWRWQDEKTRLCARDAYLPFSKGERVCSGAGFAMVEGVLLLAMLVRAFHIAPTEKVPVPVAHLTVRAEEGIYLNLRRRTLPGSGAAQKV